MIDLKPFCLREEDKYVRGVPRMTEPWNYGPFTWASDGAIIVRVAARPSVTMSDIKTDKMWEHYPTGEATWEQVDIEGVVAEAAVKLGHRVFRGKYFLKLAALRGLLFAIDFGSHSEALPFRFAGGCGLIMPLNTGVPFNFELIRKHKKTRKKS